MRVTQRSGRIGSAKHNDRSFLQGKDASEVAPHIDLTRSEGNFSKTSDGREGEFEKAELEYYEKHYGEALERRNEMYRQQRHAERCKSIEDLYHGAKTRPEELILQIGDMEEHADENTFRQCVAEYLQAFENWNKEHGNHGHILNVAIHCDEATPHAHIRRVWDYENEKTGLTELGQNKALEKAGVELPDPEKKPDRYNNRKMTFDAMMREKWQEICKDHDLEIETEPRPRRKHLDKADYISEKVNEQIEAKREALEELQDKVDDKLECLQELQFDEEKARKRCRDVEDRERQFNARIGYLQSQITKLENDIRYMEDNSAKEYNAYMELIEKRKELELANINFDDFMAAKQKRLEELQRKQEEAEKHLETVKSAIKKLTDKELQENSKKSFMGGIRVDEHTWSKAKASIKENEELKSENEDLSNENLELQEKFDRLDKAYDELVNENNALKYDATMGASKDLAELDHLRKLEKTFPEQFMNMERAMQFVMQKEAKEEVGD